METLAGLLIVPVVVGFLVSRLNTRYDRLNIPEYISLVLLAGAVGWVGTIWARDSQMTQLEFLNGQAIAKYTQDSSCSHCHTECDAKDKDGKCTSSHQECDHSFDRHWYVETDFNAVPSLAGYGKIEIDTQDRQGLLEPQRWTEIQLGEAVTVLHPFKSYLKPNGDADSFPNPSDIEPAYGKYVPVHTTQLHYDYTRAIKVLTAGYNDATIKNLPGFGAGTVNNILFGTNLALNSDLAERNKLLGPKKSANVNVIFVDATVIPDIRFADLVMSKWRGGGKNDIDLFVALNGNHITWVRVMLGATDYGNEKFAIDLRDSLLNLKTLESPTQVLDVAQPLIASEFSRKQMADFANREAGVHPTGGQLIALYIVELIISIVGALAFLIKDPFGLDRS